VPIVPEKLILREWVKPRRSIETPRRSQKKKKIYATFEPTLLSPFQAHNQGWGE